MVWLNHPHALWPAFDRLQREMTRWHERSSQGVPSRARRACALNLTTNDEEALLVARVPGVAPDAVELAVEGRDVRLEVTRDERATRREVRLPWAADADAVTATLRHGRLEVRIPRLAADRPRRIAIDTNA